MPHDLELDHEHEMSESEQAAIAQFIWEQDTVELQTVGIDIGSSTSHLLFARVVLRRLTEDLSSRFVVIDREVLWRSPIMLTPFLADGTIDAHKLEHFVQHAYRDAGIKRQDIDSGAVILTGEAIKKKNARAINEIFARESGKFVCATAGHKLECILAAHGSGATALSKRRNACVIHVDIGGGTTKFALIDNGKITSVAAYVVGGRVIAQDDTGAWARIDDGARLLAKHLGLDATPSGFASEAARKEVADRLAVVVRQVILGEPLDELGLALELTEPLLRTKVPDFVTFSGGVSEYIFSHEVDGHGDIAPLLAKAIIKELHTHVPIPVVEPAERIRATVIGASQYTVQVSGKTIYMSDKDVLPAYNIPVVLLGLDLPNSLNIDEIAASWTKNADLLNVSPQSRLALAFTWNGEPEHSRLLAMSQAIMKFAAPAGNRDEPLFLMIDGDVGASLGRILREELHLGGAIISIDGIKLEELDFVDVGEMIDPPGVIPVVIKSLLFPGDAAR